MILANLRTYYYKTVAYLKTEEAKLIFSSLPLYFSWVPILTWNRNHPSIRKTCFFSAINTGSFFFLLFSAQILSILPFVGPYLSNFIHLISVLLYLGISGFLIYSIRLKKTIDLPILTDGERRLSSFFAPIAQLDRVSDYGSEG